MLLEQCITSGEVERIKELISKMDVIGCNEVFVDYLRKCDKEESTLSYLEAEFYKKLRRYLPEIIMEVTLKEVTDYTEYAKDLLLNGSYALCEQEAYELLESIECITDHALLHPVLVEYMTKSIDEVVESELRTKEQKAKDRRTAEITSLENTIKRSIKSADEAQKRLDELTKLS